MNLQSRRSVLAIGMALACSAAVGLADDNLVVNSFDSDSETLFARWWGSAPQTYEFDSTMDASKNTASGSMKVTVGFDVASYAGDNQFAAVRYFDNSALIDGTKYTNFSFDIHWDPSSPQSGGNFGNLEYGLVPQDYSQIGLGTLPVPLTATNGWTHVSGAIDPTTAKLDSIRGVWIKIWSGDPSSGMTGTTVFWVDNVILYANTNVAAPPPSMALAKTTPGLNITASQPGQQYQRQSISTLANDTNGNANAYSWVGATTPVTYSMTIKQFPDASHDGSQAHLFLIPNGAMPYGAGDTSVDWNANHVIFLQVLNDTNGNATAYFRYKTNEPSGNTMIFNTDASKGAVGTLASITNATPVGTWSWTFQNNTSVTITAPSGATTNVAMPADAAALFADPLTAYFGFQPNNNKNIGQTMILSSVKISGTGTPLEDDFTGDTLDTSKWQKVAGDPTGINQVPAGAMFWVQWTAPATGFGLQASTNLAAGWFDPGLTNVVQIGSQKMVLITGANLPDPKLDLFRLKK